MIKHLLKKESPAWLRDAAIIFFIILITFFAAYIIFESLFSNKAYPGVRIGKLDLGGKNSEEIRILAGQEINNINQSGIAFKYGGHQAIIMPTNSTASADAAYTIIDFNIDQTIEQALKFGRDEGFFINFKNKLLSLISNQPIIAIYTLNEGEIKKELLVNFSQLEAPGKNAELNYDPEKNADESFSITTEKSGKGFDYEKAIRQLDFNLSRLDSSAIQLSLVEQLPTLLRAEILDFKISAEQYLALAPLTLKQDKAIWTIEKNELGSWLAIIPNLDIQQKNNKAIIGLNKENVEKYLKEKVATKIDQELEEARFKMVDGRVTQFQSGKDGIELDINATTAKIEEAFIKNKKQTVELVSKKLTQQTNIDSTNDLGIKELIATGVSVFTGSSKSRIKNISIGAYSLNGIIVKAGETFSLLNALGNIDASNGYLQELVIKEGKTIPEFGGGLCQVGTTIFRAAVASGLPIVERKNHSYRVSYYEPAGTDATIYDPAPDFKFMNDTSNNILIQTRMSGSSLYFDIWGTKDGRIAEQSKPTIYNIVKPKPTKLIETTNLAVGKKKCTEKAHNGADAFFDYKVTYSDGAIKEKRFSSHYVPWQEVCLIGVEKISTPENINTSTGTSTASSTIINSTTTSTASSANETTTN